ncbi:MAG TPA: hypothetical protein VNO33_12615 [Kofleriaceae bacterium]|nr:hypothetical protein [Kofleriaceae bacterium]
MSQRPKRRRRRSGEPPRKKGGIMIGMRSGFKKAAGSVVSSAEKAPPKRSWVGTAFTVLLVIAAIAFLFYRWQ